MDSFQCLTFFMVIVISVYGYSDGPPIKVCKRLTPGHPLISYKGTSAKLTAEKLPDQNMFRVTLESEVPFKGNLEVTFCNDSFDTPIVYLFPQIMALFTKAVLLYEPCLHDLRE